jgi:hypothetical protein
LPSRVGLIATKAYPALVRADVLFCRGSCVKDIPVLERGMRPPQRRGRCLLTPRPHILRHQTDMRTPSDDAPWLAPSSSPGRIKSETPARRPPRIEAPSRRRPISSVLAPTNRTSVITGLTNRRFRVASHIARLDESVARTYHEH